MKNVIMSLLQGKKTMPQQEFVKEALGVLEGNFRKMSLSLMGELINTEIQLKSLFSEVAALQRPSWGCWNGLLLGLLKARRNILNTGTLVERESVNKCEGLSGISGDMEEPVLIKDEHIMEILERAGYLGSSQKRGTSLKARELFSIPIYLRNRMAHDNIQDEKWWEDAAYVLAFILEWYAASSFLEYNSGIQAIEPWMLEEAGEFWCYNGISTNSGESIAHYVSMSGKSRADKDRASKIILGFKKLLGEEEQQEANFSRLLSKLAPEELRGFVLGGYIVGEKAGEGGFADVYKGVQLSTGRRVAIKVLKPGLADSDKLRFLHEAEYLSMFDHPNIAKIFEHNEQPWRKSQLYDLSGEMWFQDFKKNHGNILTYIAMEWIEGNTLDYIFREVHENKKSLTEKEIAQWFCDASEAVELIHNANLIHRDITPKNIMITESGVVKLMDFGISRTQFENRTVVTSHGKMLGSEPYMSPEQLDYERAKNELGPRSDIYSLGGTFYELFTLVRLYNHNNDAVSIATASALKKRGERPVNPQLINKNTSWEISTILMGCLENEPGDRYQSARQLKEDIRRYLGDMPIEYKKPGLMRRTQLMYKRNRGMVRMAAMFVLLVAALTAIYISSLIDERLQVERANTELILLNTKLEDQIALTEQQRNKASENETEARKQQKAAEDNSILAKQNENKALVNLYEAQKQKALALLNEELALENEGKATRSKLLAERNERRANEQRDKALENQSLYLAEFSDEARASGDITLAMRLALAALPADIRKPDRPYVPEAMSALLGALYDTGSGRSILKHNNPLQSAALSTDGKHITTKSSSEYESVRVWELSSGKESEIFKDLRTGWSNSCISDDGNSIAAITPLGYYGYDDKDSWIARIYDVNDGSLINSIGFSGEFRRCSMSPMGNVLVITCTDNSLLLYDVKSGRMIARDLEGDILFSRDEKLVVIYRASYFSNYIINVWNTNGELSDMSAWKPAGAVIERLVASNIIISGDSSKMAIEIEWANKKSILVYDTEDLSKEAEVKLSEEDMISDMAFNETGKYLALGFWDGAARIYNADTGKKIREVFHEGPTYPDPSEETSDNAGINNIFFNEDGSCFITASNAGNVKTWDAKTGKNISTLWHEGYVLDAMLTPDESKLISISLDKTARVWDIAPVDSKSHKMNDMDYYDFDGTNIVCNVLKNNLHTDSYMAYNIFDGSIRPAAPQPIIKVDYMGFGGSRKPEIKLNDIIIHDRDNSGRKIEFSFTKKVVDASLNADESLMAVSLNGASGSTVIELYDVGSRKKIHSWEVERTTRVDLNFTPDGKKLIVCKIKDYETWDIIVYDTVTYAKKTYNIGEKYPNYKIGRDSTSIFAPEIYEDRILVKEVTSGLEVVEVINDFGWTDVDVYFDEAEDLTVVDAARQEGAGASSAGKFRYECFNMKTGESLFVSEDETDSISHIAFSSDGRYVAISASDSKKCSLWDVKSGTRTDISIEGYLKMVSFVSDNTRLVLAGGTLSAAYVNVLELYPPEEAVSHAKQLLEHPELTEEERVQYFVADSADITTGSASGNVGGSGNGNVEDRMSAALKLKLDSLVGTYKGTYDKGYGDRDIVLNIYKTGLDTVEADLTVKNREGVVEGEYLMKVNPDILDNEIVMYCYRDKNQSGDQQSNDDFMDLQGTLENGIIRGETMSLGEACGFFAVSSRSDLPVKTGGTSSTAGSQNQSDNAATDVFSENGLTNKTLWMQGDRIYHCNFEGGIFTSRYDGTDLQKLSNDDPYTMVLTGEWIYFTYSDGLYKMKTDGRYRQRIISDHVSDICIDGDWLYYTNWDDEYKGYKMKTDGSEKQLFLNCKTWEQRASGDWIYYRNGNDGFSLHKIKKDGSGDVKLNDHNSCNLNIVGNQIFYYRPGDDFMLYRMNADGSCERINEDSAYFINVKGDWIYYVNDSDNNRPYRVRFDGSGRTKLCDDYVSLPLSICGEWVYYNNGSDDLALYRVKLDGSERQKINKINVLLTDKTY